MPFRRAFGITLFGTGAILVGNSILLRYVTWAGGAVTSPLAYWWDITFTESWAWLSMLVTGLCIIIADNEERNARAKSGGGTIG